MVEEARTALGSAHERFLRSLDERGRELRELVKRQQAAPAEDALAEQVGRRLHTLYASAQVFQEQALVEAIKLALGGIETARLERRPATPGELDAVLALCDDLPYAASNPPPARAGASERSSPAGRSRPKSGRATPESTDGLEGDTLRPHDRAVEVPSSVSGSMAAPPLLAVLVIARPEVERDVRAALPEDRCDLTSSGDSETALSVLDRVAPDVVLIEDSLLEAGPPELVVRLRGGHGAASRSVIAIVREPKTDIEALLGRVQVDAALRLPLPDTGLLDRLSRWARPGQVAFEGLDIARLQSGTVEEIARGVADEIKRGISGSLLGRGERIELGGDNTELLAATWSAIARIRTHLERRAGGRVRFDDAPYAGGPSALALTEQEAAAPYVELADPLRGRRLLLADDDPAVLWFFSNLLREAGAIPIEARDGRQALELARRKPPDVVISDILMPEVDGFTLCRELKRDLTLCHVPVILLSWKEDFLQRMRELDSGASGYLRKEAGSHQILATVASVLRPRSELAALLASGGEVQGRVEPIGVPVLLRTVAAARPDARIVLRDAWNLFEVDLRGGNSLAVTRTASDGSFARGPTALRQLLGVDSGRFSVSSAGGVVRNAFAEPLDQLIADGLRQLGAVLDAVSDSRLLRVTRISFDDGVLSSLLSATPTALADAAARLRAGEAPRELLLDGSISPRDLEQQLREFARRGAVVSVAGAEGEDLVTRVRAARESMPGALMYGSARAEHGSLPPTEIAEADVQWVDPRSAPAFDLGGHAAEPSALPLEAPRVPQPQPAPSAAAPIASAAAVQSDAAASPPAAPDARSSAGPQRSASRAPAQAGREPQAPFAVQSPRLGTTPSGRPLPSQPPPRRGAWPTLLALAALALAGFMGLRWLGQPPSSSVAARRSAPPAAQLPPQPAPTPASGATNADTALTSSTPSPQLAAAAPEPATTTAPDPMPGFGRVLPFVDRSRGVSVAPNEGLLVVEFEGAGKAPPRVRIGSRDLGTAPIATALPEGRHELVFKRGTQTSFRYVVIRSGETRIVQIRD